MEIEVDLAAAQRYGLKPGDVRRAAATLLSGIQVGNLFEEQKVFDVVVWSTPETRSSLTSIRDLLIDTPGGGQVRLGDVAQVRIVPAPTVIRHDAVKRYLDVVVNVVERDLGAVAADIERRLQEIKFPLEYHAEVLGEYAGCQQAAESRLLGIGDCRGDRDFPPAAGSLRELAPGACRLLDLAHRLWRAACWRRS